MTSEFVRLHSILGSSNTKRTVCSAVIGFSGGQRDASAEIQQCLSEALPGSVVVLPAGRYSIGTTLRIARPLVLQTEHMGFGDAPCSISMQGACAQLVAASTLVGPVAIVTQIPGVVVDHVIMNGNKAARSALKGRCQQEVPAHIGPVFVADGVRALTISNSVFRDALCSTGLGVSGDADLWRNTLAANGIHGESSVWADGMTLTLQDSWVAENIARDNTDVDIIFGRCPNCDIQDNRIEHSVGPNAFATSSFAALMIHGWPSATKGQGAGDYSGADISGNEIDCGTQMACGFGLLIGSEPWYEAELSGGTYHNNQIRRAQQGLAINGLTGRIQIYDNRVEGSGGGPNASCQLSEDVPVSTSAYSIDPRSLPFVDRSRDARATYAAHDFKGCLLNSWHLKSCAERGGIASPTDCAPRAKIGLVHDAAFCCRP